MADQGWLFRDGDLILGPVSAQAIIDKLYAGELAAASEVQALGSGRFQKLIDVPDFKVHVAKAEAKKSGAKAKAAGSESKANGAKSKKRAAGSQGAVAKAGAVLDTMAAGAVVGAVKAAAHAIDEDRVQSLKGRGKKSASTSAVLEDLAPDAAMGAVVGAAQSVLPVEEKPQGKDAGKAKPRAANKSKK